MSRTNKFLFSFIFFLGVAILSFFTLEGAPPRFYHVLFGPFLIFKYGHDDVYLGIFGGIILYLLIAMPIFLKNKAAIFISVFGIFLWLGVAKIIEGIAI